MASAKAKVITVTSVKGGTGKSTFVLNIAGVLSTKNLKTIIIDLDLTSGVIAPSLNKPSTSDIYTLTSDMMNNRFEQLDKYLVKFKDNIDVLPAPTDPRCALKIHSQYIENLIRQLEYRYDVILIDTSHQSSTVNSIALDNSAQILYVLTGDLMELKNMKTMLRILDDMNLDNYKIILNKALNRYARNYEMEVVLGKDIDYVIPETFYIENIDKLVYDGKIATLEYPKSKMTGFINKMLDDILK